MNAAAYETVLRAAWAEYLVALKAAPKGSNEPWAAYEAATEAAGLEFLRHHDQPSYSLALLAGVENRSYRTIDGRMPSFAGDAIVEMADGRRFHAIGHRASGPADCLGRPGYIEFIKVEANAASVED